VNQERDTPDDDVAEDRAEHEPHHLPHDPPPHNGLPARAPVPRTNIAVPTTMPAGPPPGMVLGMSDTGNAMVRVELDLVPDAEPIRGRARCADGIGHVFAGWLELVELLDRARVNQPPRSTTTVGESR
jgi:hypothetical protein